MFVIAATSGKEDSATRFEKINRVYEKEKEKVQTPIHLAYLKDLKSLRAKYVSQDNTSGVKAVDAEIKRVNLILNRSAKKN